MWLDGIDIDEGGLGMSSVASEASEQQREQAVKTLQNIKKTQKDEKKGKKAANILFDLLVEFLKDPAHDSMLEPIFQLLKLEIPSIYSVGILSLLSSKICERIYTEYAPGRTEGFLEIPSETTVVYFQGNTLRDDIKRRINIWIEDILLILENDPSVILTHKFQTLIQEDTQRKAVITAISVVLEFFFKEKNIIIPISEARSFSLFVLSQIEKKTNFIPLEEF